MKKFKKKSLQYFGITSLLSMPVFLLLSCNTKEDSFVPLRPFLLEIQNPEPSQITLSWKESEQEGTTYHFSYKKKNATLYSVEIELPSQYSTYTLKSLEPGETYLLRLRSKLRDRYSSYAQIETKTAKPPQSPTNFMVEYRGQNELRLVWHPAVAGSAPVEAYYISYEKRKDGVHTTYESDFKLPAVQQSHTLSKLEADSPYIIRLRAQDTSGFYSPYTQIKDSTRAFSEPPKAFAARLDGQQLILKWSSSSENGSIVYYLISYKKVGQLYGQEMLTAQLYYSFVNLKPDTDYKFRLRSKDQNGDYSHYIETSIRTPNW